MHPLLKEKKACLFDMDGTLLDSMHVWEDIDIDFFAMFGVELPPTLQQEIGGMSFHETACYIKERYHIPLSGQEIKDLWNQMAKEEYAHRVTYKPGALRFLQYCRELNLKTAICTSNSRELVEAADSNLNFCQYIDVVITADEVKRGKPFPDVYLAAARHLDVNPEDCLCFEDILAGIWAGQNAGMEVCAMEDSHAASDRARIMETAGFYITDYQELL